MSSPLSSLRKSHKNPLLLGQKHHVPFKSPGYTEDESKLLGEITSNMASQRIKTRDPFGGGLPKLDNLRHPHLAHNSPRTSNPGSLGRYHDNSTPVFDRPSSAASSTGFDGSHINNTFLTGVSKDYGRSPPNDHDLMTSMMNRISLLEQRVSHQTKEITEKDKRIKVLDEKLKILQKSQGENDDTRVNEAEKKCLLLQQKVHEMEGFLADYGMVWVGEKSNPNSNVYNDEDGSTTSSEGDNWRPGTSVSNQPEFEIDFNIIIANIKELNVLAGEGVSKIQHTTDGARLKPQDPVKFTLYSNGMMLYSGPFRSFNDPMTQTFVHDIMDGYFPSELQNRYPDGVPFVIQDLRSVHFKDKRAAMFAGAGQVLGGDTKPSRLVPSNLDKANQAFDPVHEMYRSDTSEKLQVTSEHPGKKMSTEQFLSKLPKNVIKDGKVIDIRGSVNNTLKGGKPMGPPVTVVDTDVVKDMRKRLEMEESRRPSTPRDISTLRVKSDSGNQTYILKMKFWETIGDLRKYIDIHRPLGLPDYQIVSTYPTKVYDNNSASLESAGLTPNAVLHLRQKKS
ncbi:UBX domain-containing protein 11-like isoform X3 [Mizuhopecten yessoensis]|uniref:UBX domain-containing protein 11-like isoform X3 n=1 Tax=Mizuhopecten yessoensis TaxID=6573 RepID=UPI000B45F1B9|nr:UBX domain-containing protein 11-like isoform X3 [Mizuhopecten yessoensis]